jgi:hypothetical protein
MKYFYFKEHKINLNPLIIQTAPSGRKFVLTGSRNDLQKTNHKFHYNWYFFKYIEKTEFKNQLGEIYFKNEIFAFYFENEKVQHKLNNKQLKEMKLL